MTGVLEADGVKLEEAEKPRDFPSHEVLGKALIQSGRDAIVGTRYELHMVMAPALTELVSLLSKRRKNGQGDPTCISQMKPTWLNLYSTMRKQASQSILCNSL
jgi:hypothetical protein